MNQTHDLGSFVHEVSEITDRLSDLIPDASLLPAADVDALHIEANRLWNVLRELRPRKVA